MSTPPSSNPLACSQYAATSSSNATWEKLYEEYWDVAYLGKGRHKATWHFSDYYAFLNCAATIQGWHHLRDILVILCIFDTTSPIILSLIEADYSRCSLPTLYNFVVVIGGNKSQNINHSSTNLAFTVIVTVIRQLASSTSSLRYRRHYFFLSFCTMVDTRRIVTPSEAKGSIDAMLK